jgi:hypothetical protein
MASSLLEPCVFAPPTTSGVGPSVIFSNPIQFTKDGIIVRSMGSTLSRMHCDAAVSSPGQKQSMDLFSHAVREWSGCFVHFGRCCRATFITSSGSPA